MKLNDLQNMALVCTAAIDGVCILYEFQPIEQARKTAKKTMGESELDE